MVRSGLTALALLLASTGCGGGGATSTDTNGGDAATTSYTGELSHAFTRTASMTMAVGSCSMTGPIDMTIDASGNVSATTGSPTSDVTVACQYLDEIYAARWAGTTDGSNFTLIGSASGPHARLNADASGTYTATAVDGTGSGTVTVNGAAQSWTASTSITFHLTAQ